MTWLDALILGIVEGLTEFLPVSSTGHLILTNSLLGIEGHAADVYTIVIQLGAILAVLTLYRRHAWAMLEGMLGRNAAGLRLLLKILIAFFPAVVVGLLFEKIIDKYLFSLYPVVFALIAGGVAMIVVERMVVLPRQRDGEPLKTIEELTYLDALVIGCAQCLALWPGTSRSMVSIIGAQLRGCSSAAAAEFSFLLALPTLGGATGYKLLKERDVLFSDAIGWKLILVGNVVAFVVAYFAVRGFVALIRLRGMTPFGVYRIIIGIVFLALAIAGLVAVKA